MTQSSENKTPSPATPPSGYYGEAYLRLRDFVKRAVPNNTEPLKSADILAIPDTQEAQAFSLDAQRPTPELEASVLKQLDQTAAKIEESGDCGFVFLNLDSGRGFAYRAGVEPYLASASKAPLAYFVIQQKEKRGNEEPEWERQEIEAAIKESDNDAYDAFGFNYLNEEYADWLAGYDVELNAEYGLYLYASARSMAAIWNDIYQYLKTDTESARWFADCLANTNRSFIRDGVSDTGASTWNKGGWIGGGEINSTSDAGIIELDGSAYLMTIATGQPSSSESQKRVADLAHILFSQRAALA